MFEDEPTLKRVKKKGKKKRREEKKDQSLFGDGIMIELDER